MFEELIAKIVVGGILLALFAWGFYLAGENKAGRIAEAALRKGRDEADRIEDEASIHTDQPARAGLRGLLARLRAARQRRARLRDYLREDREA